MLDAGLKLGGNVVRWKYAGLALLAVVALAVAGFSLAKSSAPAPGAGTVPSVPAFKRAKPLAIFLGDSYTAGTGASSPDKDWVSLVANAEGWDFVNLGRGGTGYTATSSVQGCGLEFCPNYGAMIPEAKSQSPDVVVIAGGQNDFTTFNSDRQGVTDAIRRTYTDARTAFPKAKIVAVGPSTPWGVNAEVTAFDKVVQDAAASVSAKYVSLIDPDVIQPEMVIEDKAHVNDSGHAAIAERVESALR